jgi:hypothetical protein
MRLQCVTLRKTSPGKGRNPKTWGFYRERNARPSACKVTDAAGNTLRIVRSK